MIDEVKDRESAKKVTFSIDKTENFPEWYEEILKVADIVDNRYPLKGMIVWKPYGFKSLKLMLKIIESILDKTGHEEVYYPTLIPESIFKKESDFLEGFGGETYVATRAGNSELTENLYLRPTSETVMYETNKLWIRSLSDLPMKLYQTVNIFRYETKQTKPILRVREVIKFKEAHTFHATLEDANSQIDEGIQIYKEFFDKLLIPYIILRTPKWDTFAGAEYNYDFLTVMPDGKVIELGSVINLGNKFAKAYDIKYKDDNDEYKYVFQTCYGISERALGVAFSIHGDNKGLIIPPIIAPIQIIIIPIYIKGLEESVLQVCNQVKNNLSNNGLRVKIDQANKSPGDKYYYWEAKGVPIRIEIGPRDIKQNQVIVARRDIFDKTPIRINDLVPYINETIDKINNNLWDRAKNYLVDRILYYNNYDRFKKEYSGRLGSIALPWCGEKDCGIELETITNIPAIGYNIDEIIDLPCSICGKTENVHWMYLGRTY